MSYAVKNDNRGWRAVDSELDILPGEYFSELPVDITLTFAQAIATLNAAYVKDRDELCAAWLRAAVADGIDESSRKEDVEEELAALDALHAENVTVLKLEYGVI